MQYTSKSAQAPAGLPIGSSYRLLCAIMASVALLGGSAKAIAAESPLAVNERPSLVVGILVEGLDESMLKLLDSQLTPGGFKRLMNEGAVAGDIDYGTSLDPVAAAAVIYTGAPPAVNGIPAANVYQPSKHRSRPILADSTQMGNFTTDLLSPAAIHVSTIADEVRIDGNGPTFVYALAADPSSAIVMAGHAGNGGYWIDDITGRWASTTYYRDLPQSISLRNYNAPLDLRLDTISWTPLLGTLRDYPDLTPATRQAGFSYRFPANSRDRYRAFKVSARGNEEVTEMASDLIHYQMLGQHQGVDMLSIGYNLAPYPYSGSPTPRAETIDAYLRLDRDIQKLLNAIDARPGADRTLVFVAGVPTTPASRPDEERWRVPTGEFSSLKARSLLNMYLMALYGNGDWVAGYHDRHFYLNHTLIQEKKLDLQAIRAEAAHFLNRMSGVSNAYTIDDVLAARVGDDPAALRRNTSVEYTGDIILEINPGWTAVDDLEGGPSHYSRMGTSSTPLIIWGGGVDPVRITEPVDARRIAPTVARLLRIRSPNAAALSPLRF